ncbi:astakine [Galendromus occidentalis]|uniref:Astakine n=1 Tax=Galendromus occidentalis TaxID=34638 RepID=A0AAJ6VYB3_9ACAR|nr:astakine [Galendromus occidentalis]
MRSSMERLSLLLISLSVFLEFAACEDVEVRSCRKPSDCDPGYCCRIGMERFSQPFCQKFGTVGDTCRMGAEPEDKILWFPGGLTFDVFGVYRQFCPCEGGLACKEAMCQPESAKIAAPTKKYNIDDFDYESLDNRAKSDNFAEFDI